MSHFQKTFLSSGLAAAALLLTGCVVAPPYVVHNARPQATANGGVSVEYYQSAPPAEYNEVVTVSPGAGYLWVPGLWLWSGGRYTWRAGEWQRPPAGYSSYNRGTWSHAPGRGWYHSGGHWR